MSGILVFEVVPNSLSDWAGLRAGDEVLAVNGRSTACVEDFLSARSLSKECLELEVLREGEVFRIALDLGLPGREDSTGSDMTSA